MPATEYQIDAFGHIIREGRNSIGCPGGKGLLEQFGLELDKSTGSTKVVKADPISIPELVASYEDQCGMEWARRMIRSGQVSPMAFADDGKHGGDFTGTTSINEAFQANKAAQAKGKAVASALGLEGEVDSEKLDEIVKERIDAILKSQATTAEGGNK